MVIQAALNYEVPLIVSDIGGMAEKVEDGFNGLHFRVGKPHSLAEIITMLADSPELLGVLKKNIKPPVSSSECADRHFTLN